MLRSKMYAPPLIAVRRDAHAVSTKATTISAKPSADPQIPRGERIGRAASCSADIRCRNRTCAASEISQASSKPVRAAPKIETNAFLGAHRSMARASTIPNEDPISANFGDPDGLSRPNAAGAHPVRPNENNMREEM